MKYLFGAYPGNDPPGYQILIKPVLDVADPSLVAAVQHVVGLAMAVLLYAGAAAPRRAPLAGRAGHRAGAARRLPAPDRADHHARRHVRGLHRRRAGRPALAPPPPHRAWSSPAACSSAPPPPPARSARSSSCPPWPTCWSPSPGWRRRLAQGAILCAAFALPDPGRQLPEQRRHPQLRARPLRGRLDLRPDGGGGGLRHAEAPGLRAGALPDRPAAAQRPGLARPPARLAHQVLPGPGRDDQREGRQRLHPPGAPRSSRAGSWPRSGRTR